MGDTQVSWDPNKSDEVENAQATFDDLVAKGYMAYQVTDIGKGEQIKKFNKDFGRIVLVPPLVGG